MLPPLVVFWLAAPASGGPAAELERWAAERGYRPVPAAQVFQPGYDPTVVAEIEALLEDARSLTPGGGDDFERLDRLLLAHPELPQAAWWKAERYALEAQLRAQASTRAPETERALTRQASALEGERAPAIGAEPALPPADAGDGQRALEVVGARPLDELVVDGQSTLAGTELSAGLHHVQLFRAQHRVWAGWVELGTPPVLRISDPTPPCSEPDLWGTERGPNGPLAPAGVRCSAWAVAHARGDQLEIAFCRGSRCDPWERRAAPLAALASAEAPDTRVPTWVTWGAVGLGAAASTLFVLWQAGVFDRSAPATQFVFTGPTAAALRF